VYVPYLYAVFKVCVFLLFVCLLLSLTFHHAFFAPNLLLLLPLFSLCSHFPLSLLACRGCYAVTDGRSRVLGGISISLGRFSSVALAKRIPV
jgi:hypothetical protein